MLSRVKIKQMERATAAGSLASLSYYLDRVVINSQPSPRAFGLIAEPWQRELIRPKIPMLEGLAGISRSPPAATQPWSFCDVLARGHDKTSLEGRLATWLLLASRRPIQGYILAEDKDQGALVLAAMKLEADLNPWVSARLSFTRNSIRGPGGIVEVVPADAGSAYGFRGNLFIFDEWANWRKPKCQDVWTAVYSGSEKMTPRVLGIVTNAGYRGSWQWEAYEGFRGNSDFVVWDKPGQLASWMSPARVAKLKDAVTPSEGRRLFDNEWIDIGEDQNYISLDEAKACSDDSIHPRMIRAPGVGNYVLIVDYGPKRDRTVLLVAHWNEATATCILDRMDVHLGGTLSDSDLRARIATLVSAFKPTRIVIDPHQTLGVIEELRAKNLPVEEVQFRGGRLNGELCSSLRTAVSHRRVRWYPGCGSLGDTDTLELELARLVTKQKDYGYRFDHAATGHDDRAFCVALAVLLCPTVV